MHGSDKVVRTCGAGQRVRIVFNVMKNSIIQIFVVFIFAYSRHIQKFTPYENFLLYGSYHNLVSNL